MPSELEGQVALVTGGGRGVGANVARARTRRDAGRLGPQHGSGRGSGARDRRARRRRGRLHASGGRRDGREGRERARPGRPARGERRDRALGTVGLGGRARRLVARPRGQRARRLPVLPGGDPGDDRARPRADRAHGERGRVPARFEVDGVQLEQGGRERGSARRSPSSWSPTGSVSSRSAPGSCAPR